jgi:DNA-binding response OmpR family regulator
MKTFTAMVIEDDLDIAVIFSKALETAGFEVTTFTASEKALVDLDTAEPDLVVLDMHMPRISGEEILHRIRSDARLSKTRVIVATADHSLAETFQSQADLVLLKPVSFTQLVDLAQRMQIT